MRIGREMVIAVRARHWMGAIGLVASLGAAAGAFAAMADNGHRSQVAQIDLITYQTGVKDVVVILGSLPAGDAMAGTGNIAIPTLTGMMLDRGTKSLDKFQIADKLDNVGAQISFAHRRSRFGPNASKKICRWCSA